MQDNNYKNTFNYFNVQSNTNVKTDFSDFGSILYCDSYSVLHKNAPNIILKIHIIIIHNTTIIIKTI